MSAAPAVDGGTVIVGHWDVDYVDSFNEHLAVPSGTVIVGHIIVPRLQPSAVIR